MNRIFFLCFTALAFFSGCKEEQVFQYDLEGLLNAYVNVWNTGDLEALDSLVTEKFELRINPTFRPVVGIDSLKNEIMMTRRHFQDFTIHPKEKSSAGINVCLITWEIVAHKKTDGGEMSIDGFSVIFHANGKITGEWIGYSDLKWMQELGYQILPPD